MDIQLTSLCICLRAQHLICFLAYIILRVVLIIRPCQDYLTRGNIMDDIIHMAVRLIIINAIRNPDNFLQVQILLQHILNFLLCEMGVPAPA